jgi:putative ABC transport system substrate-binding protein
VERRITMKRRALLLSISVLAIVILASPHRAQSQETEKVPRVAYVSGNLAGIPHRVEAFRQSLSDLGYVEGKNIVIEWRSGGRKRRPAIMAELVRLKVDVIVTGGGGATRTAKEATTTIPIVMTQDRDPVANGFVASLARPGGNITGLSRLAPDLSGKQLGLLKEIIPRLSRVSAFRSSTRHWGRLKKEIELPARGLGVKLQYLDVRGPKGIETAFREASKWHADAGLWLVADPDYNRNRAQVMELAVESGLPVIYFRRVDAEAGGLMSYGLDFTDLDRRAGIYVDKILKGIKPAELPVERPTKFDLVVNLKTARQLGITIPPSILYRADKVIK